MAGLRLPHRHRTLSSVYEKFAGVSITIIMSSYPIPAQQTRAEITVINSRFISTLAPVFSVDDARSFIAHIRAEFSDASHNVPAYIIGYGASTITHCHDDGEPAGTSGRPALAILSGSGLGDAAVVVTRYFGGTKLGTGGLVRAYSDAVRAVLAILPRAEKVVTHTVKFTISYPLFERLRSLVQTYHGQIMDEAFTDEVTITARFAVSRLNDFQEALRQATHGLSQAEIIETGPAIVPQGTF